MHCQVQASNFPLEVTLFWGIYNNIQDDSVTKRASPLEASCESKIKDASKQPEVYSIPYHNKQFSVSCINSDNFCIT